MTVQTVIAGRFLQDIALKFFPQIKDLIAICITEVQFSLAVIDG